MRQSKLFTKTIKQAPKDEASINAQLLIRAGFINKLMAGVYSYLPLGFRVLEKIKNIIRQEINAIDGQEVYMPALQPKELWDKTGRWEKLSEVMFQFKGRGDSDIGIAATHEEVITDILTKYVNSYKDLPLAVYQIQDKFRNEPRAKSGLLRGREFSMKDLYSFHLTEEDFENYYNRSKQAYTKIYNRCGLEARITEAPGGDFTTKLTHEFQVLCETGEDTIIYCPECSFSQNEEIAKVKAGDKCPLCGAKLKSAKSIEVGNIFPLDTTYSKPLNLTVTDEEGKEKIIIMGCYGIGLSRVMGTVVEVHHDDKGMIWPEEIAPFRVHLISLFTNNEDAVQADRVYELLKENNIEVLYDDRLDVRAGEKFSDSDLIGCPIRLVVSNKTVEQNGVEFKYRHESETKIVSLTEIINQINRPIAILNDQNKSLDEVLNEF